MTRDDWRIRPEDILPALLAMAAEKRNRRKPRAEIERRERTKRRNRRRRQAAALERNRKARGGVKCVAPLGEGYVDRMLAAMVPGEWYGRLDLVRLIGEGRAIRGKVNQVMVVKGYVERAPNPAYRGQVSPQRIFAGEVAEPRYVYRLAPRGLLRRELITMVV